MTTDLRPSVQCSIMTSIEFNYHEQTPKNYSEFPGNGTDGEPKCYDQGIRPTRKMSWPTGYAADLAIYGVSSIVL